MAGSLWGIDLGGTKIEGVVLASAYQPVVIFRERIPTEQEKGYRHILGRIAFLVEKMEAAVGHKPHFIGIGTPGTLDPQAGTLKNSNTTCLIGQPIKSDLEQLLGMAVKLENDANCFALAETRMGVVKENFPEAKVVFGVIMGTGVGGGIVVNGHTLSGLHGIAGEWGHNFLDDEAICYCGKKGCVEQNISGPALERYYFSLTGIHRPLREIAANHEAGTDPQATATVQRLCALFGEAISVVINILDPDVIVLGGGVGNINALYTQGITEIRKHIFNSHRLATPIVKPKLGDSAGVFGAAFLAAGV